MAVFSSLRRAGAFVAAVAALASAQGTYPITGVGNAQNVQPRLEIRQLAQNTDQFNLFLLALQDFKNADQGPIDSYYSISGIHGVPNVPWDNVQPDSSPGYGYCTHVSPLFPAWHRAYTLLLEQAFMGHVTTIVNQFQGADLQRYQQAAQTLRFPYWDWAAVQPNGQPVFPTQMTDFQVNVNTPTGQQTIENPLFRYDFHPLDSAGMVWAPYDEWQTTLRYPYNTSPQSGDDNANATAVIQADNPSLRQRIYNIMTQCNDYAGFGQGDASQRPPQCPESLEDIHNNIHNDVGGVIQGNPSGHMAIIPVAAFDPAFWMHHMNVDRMFALWQGVYPGSYDVRGTSASPTFSIPQGTQCDGNTFLAPFHADANGGPHTSLTMQNTTTFGYTYPEFTSGDTSPTGIMGKINTLYGNGAAPATKRSLNNPYEPHALNKKAVGADANAVAGAASSAVTKILGGASPVSPASTPGSTMAAPSNSTASGNSNYDLPPNLANQLTPTGRAPIDYSCKVTVQPYNLGGSARIFVFLGAPASENPSSWPHDSALVGWAGTFASPGMTETTTTAANIPLTAALLKQQANGVLPGIAVNQTTPLLQQQLQWRVQGPNGVIPNDQCPGLTVGVLSAPVQAARSNNEFPTWGNWTMHQEVTHGKAGGIQQGMSSDWVSQCAPAPP